ncbi:hypothetical protein AMTR_s00086p00109120 [Amborella trichopoda]|uniref:Uncharacterized protein n=1 Tax=Amborella trichopoda TaxID=13333 RepID=W1P5E5_AMBTC|nr:hypothetical protein AMTR_s00086p00109120 [Amborella trichopoda]
MIKDKPRKGDYEVLNHKNTRENLSVSPYDHIIFKNKGVVVDRDLCIKMISINRDYTPSQDKKVENP